MVSEFHVACELPVSNRPTLLVDREVASLRAELLSEEVGEYLQAVDADDLVRIADALADIVYVAYGAALTYGVDLDAVLREVHRSNMSKVNSDGSVRRREDGKVIKSESFSEPAIREVLARQSALEIWPDD
jgi:predicted HAD superfamily Cof-like phosphohydrolase